MFWIGLVVGLFIGGNLGILTYAIISVNKTKDEKEIENEKI